MAASSSTYGVAHDVEGNDANGRGGDKMSDKPLVDTDGVGRNKVEGAQLEE